VEHHPQLGPRLSASLIQQLGQPINSNLEMLAAVSECKYNLRNASIIAKRFLLTYYGLTRLLFLIYIVRALHFKVKCW
jgi:hypothetical protein